MAAFDALLAVRDVHTYYGDSYVLHGLSLELSQGKIVAIIGRNGMGKTTLIRSIAGLTPPRRGDVVFEGQSLIGKPAYEIAQSGMAIVPQGRRIFKSLTVRENLLLPTSSLAGHRKTDPSRKQWTLDAVLEEFPQLAERMDNTGNALSGGEQQMLAIGRALVLNPKLLLLDEPTEGLAPIIVEELLRALRSLFREEGLAAIVVEQHARKILELTDDAIVLERGRVVLRGDSRSLLAEPERLERFLGLAAAA